MEICALLSAILDVFLLCLTTGVKMFKHRSDVLRHYRKCVYNYDLSNALPA